MGGSVDGNINNEKGEKITLKDILFSDMRNEIELEISNIFEKMEETNITNAMKYSIIGSAGKRIRPILLLECYRMLKGEYKKAIPFAISVEMLHTYSLIHDDLPCMDDDNMRRGKPSNHIMFGESTALLAGDALLTLAFENMTNQIEKIEPDRVLRSINCLSSLSGYDGMIKGQMIDLNNENKNVSLDELNQMNILKTAKLMIASCKIGCILASGNEDQIRAVEEYGKNLGIAFQIVDDILDSGEQSDSKNLKSTYVGILGIEKSRQLAKMYTNKAIDSLIIFGERAENLKELSLDLEKRII